MKLGLTEVMITAEHGHDREGDQPDPLALLLGYAATRGWRGRLDLITCATESYVHLWKGSFRNLDIDDFEAAFAAAPWLSPERVQLFLKGDADQGFVVATAQEIARSADLEALKPVPSWIAHRIEVRRRRYARRRAKK